MNMMSMPGGVRAHYGLYREPVFKTPATFHIVAKSHYTVQWCIKGGRMGRSDKVSLWCVSLIINTRFRFFILE